MLYCTVLPGAALRCARSLSRVPAVPLATCRSSKAHADECFRPDSTPDSTPESRFQASLLPVTEVDIIHIGQPYGALHQELTDKQLTPSMAFTIGPDYTDEVQPWLDLIRNGTFSASTFK